MRWAAEAATSGGRAGPALFGTGTDIYDQTKIQKLSWRRTQPYATNGKSIGDMQKRGFRLPGANYQVHALDVCKCYAGCAGSATQRPGYRKRFGGWLLRPRLGGMRQCCERAQDQPRNGRAGQTNAVGGGSARPRGAQAPRGAGKSRRAAAELSKRRLCPNAAQGV